MRWSPVTMGMRTTLMNNIGVSANSSFSLYGLSERGTAINTFAFEQNRKLMRLTSFSVSLDFDLGRLLSGNKERSSQQTSRSASYGAANRGMMTEDEARSMSQPGDETSLLFDEYGYYIFDVTWSMRVSYNINYSKPGFKSNLAQTLSASGNVNLTGKTAITYTTGYDFSHKEITMTQIGITRDLHCWVMSFNWVPNGSMKMWNFTIRVKSSVLADLKYERRKDYHDNL